MQSTLPTGLLPSPMLEGFESFAINAESSASRRQRISMACQYCRHRKIRCCGGAPCRNCTRSSRECEYAPVPEEVNRATREKKAMAKSTKPISSPSITTTPHLSVVPATSSINPSPMSTYSPYFLDVPTFGVSYMASAPVPASAPAPMPHRPVHLGHRRTSSAPTYDSAAWIQQPPSAPLLNSPAKLESSAWMYNGWSAALPVPTIETSVPAPAPSYATPHRAFPSVLEQTPAHSAYLAATQPVSPYTHSTAQMDYSVPTMPITPPDSRSGSIEADYNQSSATSSTYLSTPTTYLRPPAQNFKGLTISTPTWSAPSYPYTPPISPNVYYTPYATPSLYSSSSSSAQTTVYTPSPPAEQISPTLAPEMTYKAPEPLVGLGLGVGMGMGMGMGMNMGMGMTVPQVEHDVFYTPNMGSEEYFTTSYQ